MNDEPKFGRCAICSYSQDQGTAKPDDRCMDPKRWLRAGLHVYEVNTAWRKITRAMAGEYDEDDGIWGEWGKDPLAGDAADDDWDNTPLSF